MANNEQLEKELGLIGKALRKRRTDTITAKEILAWAEKHTESGWYAMIGDYWDDEKAGEQHRLHLIRGRLATIHVEGNPQQRRYISPIRDRHNGEGGGYRDVETMSAAEVQHRLAIDLLQQLIGIRRQGDAIKRFSKIWDAIDAAQTAEEKRPGRWREKGEGARATA